MTAVGDSGATLTAPATQQDPITATITPAPHGTALAPMLITTVQVYDPGKCPPVTAKGLRIHPPGQSTPLFLREDGIQVCGGGGPNTMSLQSIH